MAEQEQTPKQQPESPTPQELYGSQGNEGQYGQGQYDSEGKPDMNGTQAQRIIPELQEKLEKQNPLTDQSGQEKV